MRRGRHVTGLFQIPLSLYTFLDNFAKPYFNILVLSDSKRKNTYLIKNGKLTSIFSFTFIYFAFIQPEYLIESINDKVLRWGTMIKRNGRQASRGGPWRLNQNSVKGVVDTTLLVSFRYLYIFRLLVLSDTKRINTYLIKNRSKVIYNSAEAVTVKTCKIRC